MYEHDLLAGHPASEELSRELCLRMRKASCALLLGGHRHRGSRKDGIGTAGGAGCSPGIGSPLDKVLQSFSTWAFKREQPSDPPAPCSRS